MVDDDFRNIFALTALLERGELDVVAGRERRRRRWRMLDERDDIDIVLMDIMMPEMNGYETMAAIRERPDSPELPIIAVTGKVVGGERERCLAAGRLGLHPQAGRHRRAAGRSAATGSRAPTRRPADAS